LKLLLITEQAPFGPGEAFLYPEIRALQDQGIELRILPAFPVSQIVHYRERELHRLLLQPAEGRRSGSTGFLRKNLGVFSSKSGVVDNAKKFLKNRRMQRRAACYAAAVRNWKPDHIHAQWANYTATMAWCLSEYTNTPWSFTAHRYDIAFDNLFRLKARSASFVRFISQFGLNFARENSLLPPEANAYVIHLGVELAPDVPHSPGATKPKIVIAFPGALTLRKGQRIFLDAVAQLPSSVKETLSVVFYGDGPLRQELEAKTADLNLRSIVTFAGQMRHSELLSKFHDGLVDIVVLSSMNPGGLGEGIPVSLMEAMAHRIPVIASRAGGTPELLSPDAGILVEPEKVDQLSAAILELATNGKRREQLGEKGYLKIQAEFSSSGTVSSLLKLFKAAGRGQTPEMTEPREHSYR
jgi:colanic acid/amylovoran biosynthesis glycosyltransferase